MKIYILSNDEAKEGFESEFGLSLFIEGKEKLLFDTGASDVFKKNAEKLKLKIDGVKTIVASHGHADHNSGLEVFEESEPKKRVIGHPKMFQKRYLRREDAYVGLPITKLEADDSFELELHSEPFNINDSMVFLGEIPRKNDFEGKRTNFSFFSNDRLVADFTPDDSALAIKTSKGLVVVTGCSHSGICNILEYAKQVTGEKKILAVIGGFHMLEVHDSTLNKTVNYLKDNGVEKIIPLHCIDEAALKRLGEDLSIEKHVAGDVIEFED